MYFNWNHLKQLVKRELLDLARNKNVSLMCPIPILLTLFFVWVQSKEGPLGFADIELLNISFNMNLVIVSTFALSLLISEEKENKTSLSLWLASVSPLELLVSKMILMLVLSMITQGMIYVIIGFSFQYFFNYLLISIVASVLMILFGVIMGLLAHHQMAISYIGLPVVLVFFIIPITSRLPKPWSVIATIFPNYHFGKLIFSIINQIHLDLFHISVLTGWILLSLFGVVVIYRLYQRKFFDLE